MPISSASSLHFFSSLNGNIKCTMSTPSNAFLILSSSNLPNFIWFFAETSVSTGTYLSLTLQSFSPSAPTAIRRTSCPLALSPSAKRRAVITEPLVRQSIRSITIAIVINFVLRWGSLPRKRLFYDFTAARLNFYKRKVNISSILCKYSVNGRANKL